MTSEMYGFLLNMWIMNRIDGDYLTMCVNKTFIRQEEREMIMATPQL